MKNRGFFTKKCAIIILIIGLLLSITTIIISFIDFETNNNLNNTENNITLKKRTKEDIQSDISSLEEQINILNNEKKQLINERNELFLNEGFSDNYNSKTEEIILKGKEIYYLETELDKYEDELFFYEDDIFNGTVNIFDSDFLETLNLSFKTRLLILGIFIILFTLFSYLCITHGYRRKQLIINKMR